MLAHESCFFMKGVSYGLGVELGLARCGANGQGRAQEQAYASLGQDMASLSKGEVCVVSLEKEVDSIAKSF